MDISIYFTAVNPHRDKYDKKQFGSTIDVHSSSGGWIEPSNHRIAIIGIAGDDDRSASPYDCAADEVRKYLYELFESAPIGIVDLGNIRQGFTPKDTFFAVSSVVSFLLKKNIIPIFIGGGQEITYPCFLAYQDLEQMVNIVSVDPKFDFGDIEKEVNADNFLTHIILHNPNYLFNLSNIGYQTYFTDPAAIDLMSKLYFDAYRLGLFKMNMEEIEPIVRNADIISFDVAAIRHSDAPGRLFHSPNGFYGEDACQIMKYAGMSDKTGLAGIFNLDAALDVTGQTAHLVAQMIWCFIDGVIQRRGDHRFTNKKDFTKFIVFIEEGNHEIIFYKSHKTDRWWMEVPYPQSRGSKFERHLKIPCSYKDYQMACGQELPDRWWQTFQKLS